MIGISRMRHLLIFFSVACDREKGLRGRCKGRKSGSDESVRWPLINQTLRQSKVNFRKAIYSAPRCRNVEAEG
jgi:hypothetical protein